MAINLQLPTLKVALKFKIWKTKAPKELIMSQDLEENILKPMMVQSGK
eukprot:CAMPEP_0197004608 /NCGR_PEP_ID=MMETSP1380-20130617/23956_1 /TAXON_ID=5936 /ORGANISM="Euplotes crassus, Strain CT5" /LENGTH=47 /DNA_ID= /DNA_START= /DNA_END= /DNA_ORIENTATION=